VKASLSDTRTTDTFGSIARFPRTPLPAMNEPRPADLEARVARLESMVAEIHAQLVAKPAPAAAESASKARPLLARGKSAPVPRAEAWAHRSEQWLGRVGLGLLFLGLVYLFNYSIEQGWITPLVRVAIGLLIGGVLLASGLRLQGTRRSYSQILLAGALAVFYVTGFAASQLYLLVSYGAAFVYMAGVMGLGLALARRQDHPSLASLGALGGFATPLLLHRESAAVMELSVYGALVVACSGTRAAPTGATSPGSRSVRRAPDGLGPAGRQAAGLLPVADRLGSGCCSRSRFLGAARSGTRLSAATPEIEFSCRPDTLRHTRKQRGNCVGHRRDFDCCGDNQHDGKRRFRSSVIAQVNGKECGHRMLLLPDCGVNSSVLIPENVPA